MLPFKEISRSSNSIERIFEQSISSEDLMWHRDLEDRVLYPISTTYWMIQIEDELPKRIEAGTIIPAGVWHRLIKGTGDLNITIQINNIEDAQSLYI